MEATGRVRRCNRLFDPVSGRTVLLPIDQPVTMGPIDGLAQLGPTLPGLLAGAPDGVVAHRGALTRIPADLSREISLIMHLSAGTSLSGRGHVKTLVGSAEDALRVGAEAVSVQVTFGVAEELDMLADLAEVSAACSRWGLPLLTMIYVRGVDPAEEPRSIAHAARVAAELGSDIVKVPYTGSSESFATVVQGCFAPVIVAGGDRIKWNDLLLTVEDALAVGAAGVCVGRNVFQHEDPEKAMTELRARVHVPARSPVPARCGSLSEPVR